jgi:hypothetical protein
MAGDFIARSGRPILRNLPPASVWTYRRPGHAAPPRPKIMKLFDQAEMIGRRFDAHRKAAGLALTRQSKRMRAVLAREAAAFLSDRDRRR